MFQDIYPQPHTGGPLRAKDKQDWLFWMGVRGDETRLVRCRFCGFICDPVRDLQVEKESYAGKGVDLGTQKSTTYVVGNGGKTVTDYYYEPDTACGCPGCGSLMYAQDNPISRT